MIKNNVWMYDRTIPNIETGVPYKSTTSQIQKSQVVLLVDVARVRPYDPLGICSFLQAWMILDV